MTPKASAAPLSLPFKEHLNELRQRLFIIGFSVAGFSVAAYFVQQHITDLLLKPAKGQQFIFTTPGGGIDFLFRVCLYTGIVFSLPVIAYNILRYLQPLIHSHAERFIVRATVVSGLLALLGVAFGYFIGLPAAMEFLTVQFSSDQIEPLITINSYLNFVVFYLAGAALMFQLPLIMVAVNRLKPLNAKSLLRYERWVILIAFIVGALINPSPNPISLVLVSAPFIVMYQVGILIIHFTNRRVVKTT